MLYTLYLYTLYKEMRSWRALSGLVGQPGQFR